MSGRRARPGLFRHPASGNLHRETGALRPLGGDAGSLSDDRLRGRSACDHGLAGSAQTAPCDPRGCGGVHRGRLDPEALGSLFNQSQVVAHPELAWIFNCGPARLAEPG